MHISLAEDKAEQEGPELSKDLVDHHHGNPEPMMCVASRLHLVIECKDLQPSIKTDNVIDDYLILCGIQNQNDDCPNIYGPDYILKYAVDSLNNSS